MDLSAISPSASFIDAYKESIAQTVTESFDFTQAITSFLTPRAITADCEILEIIQEEFHNIRFVFVEDKSCVPFLHLFKNSEEGFALYLKHVSEKITHEMVDELNQFTLDERVEILKTAIKTSLISIDAKHENRYIIVYGGSDIWCPSKEPDYIVQPILVHRLSILEVKL